MAKIVACGSNYTKGGRSGPTLMRLLWMGPHDLVAVDKPVIGESKFIGVVSMGLHMSDVDPHAPLIAGYNHPN